MSYVRKTVSSGLFAGLGLGGIVVGVVDTYQDLALQGEPAGIVALENTVPVALGGVLLWLAWDVYWQGEDETYLSTVAKVAFISVVGVGLVGGWVIGLQLVQGVLKPFVVLLDTLVAVAVLGTIAGINRAERDVERERYETLIRQVEHPIAEAYVGDGLTVSGTNEAFRETFGDVTSVRLGRETARSRRETTLGDAVDFVTDDPLAAVEPSLERGEAVDRDVRVETHGGALDCRLRLVPVPRTTDPLEVAVLFLPDDAR